MKKAKRVIAWIGIIILVSMYALTIVLAIVDKSSSMKYFMASIIATLVIPVLIWTITFFMDRNKQEFNEEIKYSTLKSEEPEETDTTETEENK